MHKLESHNKNSAKELPQSCLGLGCCLGRGMGMSAQKKRLSTKSSTGSAHA